MKLAGEYINVNECGKKSIGGSQGYFRKTGGCRERGKHRGGCGIVALGDLCLYLADKKNRGIVIHGREYRKTFSSVDEYKSYFDDISRAILWIPGRWGVSVLVLTLWFNILSMRFGLGAFGFWGLSRRRLNYRIKRMIKRNIPVVLCIPFVINPLRRKNTGIRMYEADNMERWCFVNGHFVTVIGICKIHNTEYYRITSWGKEFLIDAGEYDKLLGSIAFGNFLGNCLVII